MNNIGKIRNFSLLKKEKYKDEQTVTITSRDQIKTEHSIEKCFDRFDHLVCLDKQLPILHRKEHIRFIEVALQHLSSSYECLDSSRPWLVYWILNSAHLLNHKFSDELLNQTIDFLVKCRSDDGGFCGGPGQYPHLATTYAAVNSLCIIGTERAYEAIDRKSLKKFLYSVREDNGAFRMHVDGETDIRGVYCAVTVSKLANYSTQDELLLFDKTVDWIVSCQSYEGGIGGAPDLEAHGGYTFCGIAALALLRSTGNCNIKALMRWAINRQMRYEGGFQGRTNKLVDGCYSFWQGAILPIAQNLLNKSDAQDDVKSPLFNRSALQEYILLCCQYPTGGLLDKPGKPPDLYHTCYTLSGLSIAQHCEMDMYPLLIGNAENEVLPTHPLFNVPPKSVRKICEYFQENNYDLYCENNENGIWDNDSDVELPPKTHESTVSDDGDDDDDDN